METKIKKELSQKGEAGSIQTGKKTLRRYIQYCFGYSHMKQKGVANANDCPLQR